MKKRDDFNEILRSKTECFLGLTREEYDNLIKKHNKGVHYSVLLNYYWEIYGKKAI